MYCRLSINLIPISICICNKIVSPMITCRYDICLLCADSCLPQMHDAASSATLSLTFILVHSRNIIRTLFTLFGRPFMWCRLPRRTLIQTHQRLNSNYWSFFFYVGIWPLAFSCAAIITIIRYILSSNICWTWWASFFPQFIFRILSEMISRQLSASYVDHVQSIRGIRHIYCLSFLFLFSFLPYNMAMHATRTKMKNDRLCAVKHDSRCMWF